MSIPARSGIRFSAIALGLALAIPSAHAQDAGNPEEGAKVFKKCATCHIVEEAKNKVGPTLKNVIGRTPGTVEGFNYSNAMKEFGASNVWDEATLTTYLADPKGVVKGTKMAFAGLKKPEEIANVIAYLKTFSDAQ